MSNLERINKVRNYINEYYEKIKGPMARQKEIGDRLASNAVDEDNEITPQQQKNFDEDFAEFDRVTKEIDDAFKEYESKIKKFRSK
ncbi:hypothetical protein [Dickeya oryzae]|uniref:hypothetical protein n=1 Tax=Dickeya oryzae TaxID=1240404 RepID=UPI001295614D|nr:hypothetical protein [Dickeya oryzae]